MKTNTPRELLNKGFTLIELLVVVAIIAILAGAAMPAMQGAILSGRQTRAASDARQIVLALKMYAGDHDGAFPSAANEPDEKIKTSNDAFRLLIPSYLDSENVFAVSSSKAGPKADNKIDTPDQILARGENHWAYVSGLSSSSNSNYPLVADHTDRSGYYGTKESELGGTWKGTKGISVRVDGAASVTKLEGTGSKRYLPRFNDKKKNALQVRDYMGDGVTLLEPQS